MSKVLVYSTRKSKKLIAIDQANTDQRDKYLEELNINLMLTFESMTPTQQLKHYGTTALEEIRIS